MQERRIDDYWNIDGSRDLSASWTGFTQFTLLEEKPPDGYTGCCIELVLFHWGVWQQKFLLQPTPLFCSAYEFGAACVHWQDAYLHARDTTGLGSRLVRWRKDVSLVCSPVSPESACLAAPFRVQDGAPSIGFICEIESAVLPGRELARRYGCAGGESGAWLLSCLHRARALQGVRCSVPGDPAQPLRTVLLVKVRPRLCVAARQRAESCSTSHIENDGRRNDGSTRCPRPLVASIISRFAAVGLHLLEPHHDEDWAHLHENWAHRETHHRGGPHERRMGHPQKGHRAWIQPSSGSAHSRQRWTLWVSSGVTRVNISQCVNGNFPRSAAVRWAFQRLPRHE